MKVIGWLLLVIACGVSPALVSGQSSEGGHLEVGAQASFNRYDPSRLDLDPDYGLGVRLGWFFIPSLSVEASASRALTRHPTLGGVEVSELGATALGSFRLGRYNRVFGGVGYSRLIHSGGATFTDDAVHAILGDRIPLSPVAALRLEAQALYAPRSSAPPEPGGRAISLRFSVGVSMFVGKRAPRDGDGDLVADRADLCPDTPLGLVVDGSGCPRDSDQDNVFDGRDLCQATPAGVVVDAEGCALDGDDDGVPDHLDSCPDVGSRGDVDAAGCPPDDDVDGVPNALDLCPDTVEGVAVNSSGCPLDSDRDRVPDHLDRCAGTPLGQHVDDLGCPILFENPLGEAAPLVLLGVNFELGEAVLTPTSFAVLDQVAASLLAHPEVHVEVAGHTDDLGTESLNQELSLARAEAVRTYLISQGVSADRLIARGYGAMQPVATNTTEEGRARNRRVELRRMESG